MVEDPEEGGGVFVSFVAEGGGEPRSEGDSQCKAHLQLPIQGLSRGCRRCQQ